MTDPEMKKIFPIANHEISLETRVPVPTKPKQNVLQVRRRLPNSRSWNYSRNQELPTASNLLGTSATQAYLATTMNCKEGEDCLGKQDLHSPQPPTPSKQ